MRKPIDAMFRTKICGITTVDDARCVARAGADAVGLNFYPKSKRYLDETRAEQIVEALPRQIVKVGLFVNAAPDEVIGKHDRLGLDLIQLHGDESPEMIASLAGRPVMRAFRLDERGLDPILAYLDRCRERDCLPTMTLIDSFVKDAYGGTGQTADWATAARYPGDSAYPPLVLAGGLTPENVADAIRAVGPRAVDTASGVESSPGQKDARLAAAFVQNAVAAFDGSR